ncbi:MAG: hypothetical protein K0R65_866 [Crocinitomicaceae bacterium]|jgi:hypothetical protein|nr:hypothetical protein [Crocinitomicaceae bacterium]
MTEKEKLSVNIGKIVSLKSNHLRTTNQYDEIKLAGEPNYITPLMVIKEVLDSKSDKVDEETGELKNVKGNLQYRCIWFSNKSFKFEEGWFFHNELLFVKLDNAETPTLKFGDNVVLKTNFLELKKRKTYLEIDKDKSNNKISGLLNFCSPVFIFLGYSSVEKKEALIDPNTGKSKRAYCSKLVKLKSFNVKEDKYSEFLVPIEAIEKVLIQEKLINDISIALEENKKEKTNSHYMIEKDENFGVYSPKSILSVSNFYTLECVNIFKQSHFEISLNDTKLKKIELPFHVEFYPDIQSVSGGFIIETILNHLQEGDSKNLRGLYRNIYLDEENRKSNIEKLLGQLHIYKIGYKNKHEKYTNRFVIPLKLVEINIEKSSEKDKINDFDMSKEKDQKQVEFYLYSFCLLRNDYRFFKIDRMQYLEIHNTPELVESAINFWLISQAKYKL